MTSKAPPDCSPTSRAIASSSRVSGASGNGSVEAWALKREISDDGSHVESSRSVRPSSFSMAIWICSRPWSSRGGVTTRTV